MTRVARGRTRTTANPRGGPAHAAHPRHTADIQMSLHTRIFHPLVCKKKFYPPLLYARSPRRLERTCSARVCACGSPRADSMGVMPSPNSNPASSLAHTNTHTTDSGSSHREQAHDREGHMSEKGIRPKSAAGDSHTEANPRAPS